MICWYQKTQENTTAKNKNKQTGVYKPKIKIIFHMDYVMPLLTILNEKKKRSWICCTRYYFQMWRNLETRSSLILEASVISVVRFTLRRRESSILTSTNAWWWNLNKAMQKLDSSKTRCFNIKTFKKSQWLFCKIEKIKERAGCRN